MSTVREVVGELDRKLAEAQDEIARLRAVIGNVGLALGFAEPAPIEVPEPTDPPASTTPEG